MELMGCKVTRVFSNPQSASHIYNPDSSFDALTVSLSDTTPEVDATTWVVGRVVGYGI